MVPRPLQKLGSDSIKNKLLAPTGMRLQLDLLDEVRATVEQRIVLY